MNATRYRRCLDLLGLSQRGLAPLLGCSDRLTREWATGKADVPPTIAAWLEANVRALRADPEVELTRPPADWRRKPDTLVRFEGEMLTLSEACRRAGVPSRNSVLFQVERYGMSLQRAFDRVIRQRGWTPESDAEEKSHARLVAAINA